VLTPSVLAVHVHVHVRVRVCVQSSVRSAESKTEVKSEAVSPAVSKGPIQLTTAGAPPLNAFSRSALVTSDEQLKANKEYAASARKWDAHIASDDVVARTAKALTDKKHSVTVVDTPAAALALLQTEQFLPKNAAVAFGGSVTLDEIGFIDAVKKRTDLKNYRALAMEAMAKGDMAASGALRMEGVFKADVFFSSISALTESGDIVTADASGTRSIALVGGAKRVVVVVSANKIVPTLADAMDRLEQYIVPLEGAHMRGVYKIPGTNLQHVGKCLVSSPHLCCAACGD
jgi:hypothetical protein